MTTLPSTQTLPYLRTIRHQYQQMLIHGELPERIRAGIAEQLAVVTAEIAAIEQPEPSPLAVAAVDVEDALGFYDLPTERAADIAAYLTERRVSSARCDAAYRARKAAEQAPIPRPRLRACVERWPDAVSGGYDPRCCRFPKSCSADIYDPERVQPADLEDR